MSMIQPITPATTAGITCTVADLRRAVTAACSIVERRNTIPVIGCLRIIPLDDQIEVEGTNLDTWLSVRCAATCKPGDAMLVDARLFRIVLAGADAGDTISIDRAADILTLRIGSVTMQLRQLCGAADWPDAPSVKGMTYSKIPETTLAKLIDSTSWAISTEETRYYLNGIYLHARDGALAAAATDGHRIALYQSDWVWPLPALIFPRFSVPQLRRLLTAGGNRDVKIGGRADAPAMVLRGEGWSMVAKCIDGKYPDYSRVIPDRGTMRGHAVINRDLMRLIPDTTKATDLHNAIKIDLGQRAAILSSVSLGLDVEAPITAEGDFAIAFNQRYLRGLVQRFGTIRIEASARRDVALLLTDDPALTVAVMPMRV